MTPTLAVKPCPHKSIPTRVMSITRRNAQASTIVALAPGTFNGASRRQLRHHAAHERNPYAPAHLDYGNRRLAESAPGTHHRIPDRAEPCPCRAARLQASAPDRRPTTSPSACCPFTSRNVQASPIIALARGTFNAASRRQLRHHASQMTNRSADSNVLGIPLLHRVG